MQIILTKNAPYDTDLVKTLLDQKNELTITEICAQINVSPRRTKLICRKLQKQGFLRICYGYTFSRTIVKVIRTR